MGDTCNSAPQICCASKCKVILASTLSYRLDFISAPRGLVLPFKLIYTSGGIYQFLFAREERVALGTDFHADIALMGGPRFENVSTGADDIQFIVGGMNSGFHGRQETSFQTQYSMGRAGAFACPPGSLR